MCRIVEEEVKPPAARKGEAAVLSGLPWDITEYLAERMCFCLA